jgi:beta-fructofuranosidase
MVLKYSDRYVWDHWMFDDGEKFHIFYLQALRRTDNASERHLNASIGHATSTDLRNWNEVGTALKKSDSGSWDDVATWTGSVIQNPTTNEYLLFYTGVHKSNDGLVQAIGLATSPDLIHWSKYGNSPIAQADPMSYACQENGSRDTDFRDPWVFFDQRDAKWHMLITATSLTDANIMSRGIVGHAISEDLFTWHVLPPLTGSTGFGQTEVLQVVAESGKHVGIFCCGSDYIKDKSGRFTTGTYSVPMDSPIGPFHFDRADIFDAPHIYAGRVIRDREGKLNLIGFVTASHDSHAPCEISDPIPVRLTENGTLQVL